MPLQKQNVSINFSQGLDTKTDSKQVQLGKFLSLENTIFTKGGLLQKRNGYAQLTPLPDTSYSYVTTLNGNLTAIGPTIAAYSDGIMKWVSRGSIAPMEVSTQVLIRNNLNQTQCDSVVASNGLVCTVYSEDNAGTIDYKYVIADSDTGQNVVVPTLIPAGGGVVTGSPRVFSLGRYFVIVFTNVISASPHLQFIAISSVNPQPPAAATNIASGYTPASTVSWDGIVSNNNLYLAYDTTAGGQSIKVLYINDALQISPPASFSGYTATMMSLAVDTTVSNPIVYVSFYNSGSSTGYTLGVNYSLQTVFTPQETITSGTVLNLASAAQNGSALIFSEVSNAYGYDSSIPTNYINGITVSHTGVVGSQYNVIRSVGLASKAFIVSGVIYFLSAYQSTYQPSYFLINGSTSIAASPVVVGKLAYENGGGYLPAGLPSVTVTGTTAQVPYLYKDLIEALNTLGNTQQTTAGGIYSQTGINLASFNIESTTGIDTAEIGFDLQISGGFLWMYDGYLPVEHNFFLWPDNVETTPSSTGGAMLGQQYFYQAIYEWADNQGNIFRSAPSIPVETTVVAGSGITFTSAFAAGATSITVSSVTGLAIGQVITDTTTGANIQTGTYITSISGTTVGLSLATAGASAGGAGDTLETTQTGSVVIDVPTLRLTYKTANPVKICIYRWSAAQQVYYQVTSIIAPLLNSTTTDYVTFTDTQSDEAILGNEIIYTTGGVLEDVNAPATNILTLFDDRMWMVDAEDPNLLWFSKQVIEGTPVEMSDLLTFYVAPTAGAQGSTGPITALSPMDDKLIIFKNNAIYYINGSGPDNTGVNSQYSQPIFITATVGCANQQSIVFTPNGLMFQSDKGIWLLGRDLSTQYIGAPVEEFNASTVQSAVNVPATNQVRFTLNTGQTLMYDYYYAQWGTFSGVPAISSCIFQGLHSFINKYGSVYQESPGTYQDGTNPVLISFTTSWINLLGLQGYLRSHFFFLIGQYITPHKLNLDIAYDYNSSPEQSVLISPNNFASTYGTASPYGDGTYGGSGDLEQWRVFLDKQRCQAFQISLQEVYDPTYGVPAGEGLTLSGLNLIYSAKKGWRTISGATSTSGS